MPGPQTEQGRQAPGKLRIAVFASGSGSNFQAIADQAASGQLDVQVELLVCDRPGAYVIERAEKAGVPAFVFSPKDYGSREDYERVLLDKLRERQIDLVVLAGYMRLLTPVLVEPYYGRMINIHPSLLPAFPGTHGARDALEYGVKVTGVTVHFVDLGMDTGPIIAQEPVPIQEGDTEDTLIERIHQVERELYPRVIGWMQQGRVQLKDRKVAVLAE
ncbi:phosphoribosylglycinamide formyltransferase [Xylanibacillus composti]|nr:phosphoribosylglycinamide formyltransferase [Xylanibacillus composti]MDT9725917.1 phosphoribosylglycinamide formyltransferase [Xylanibacillus composti]